MLTSPFHIRLFFNQAWRKGDCEKSGAAPPPLTLGGQERRSCGVRRASLPTLARSTSSGRAAEDPPTLRTASPVRSGLNNLFIFSKLREARSRLYRRQML